MAVTVIKSKSGIPAKRIGVVVSRWNELVTTALLGGCLDELEGAEVVVVWVPGAWEIPIAVNRLLHREDVAGVVALGCILQGATNHAALLAGDVAGSLMSQQISEGKPVSWGILTPENQEQALERTGMKLGHKGREAAGALLEMISVLDQI